ncbi:MBOAT, membrane-bound O-acyltransferase family-domain-containing protein [Dipodascopsis uninucleata]
MTNTEIETSSQTGDFSMPESANKGADSLRQFREMSRPVYVEHLSVAELSDRDQPGTPSSNKIESLKEDKTDSNVDLRKLSCEVSDKDNIIFPSTEKAVVATYYSGGKRSRKARRPKFHDVKFQPNTTILEGEAGKNSVFSGFYVLFWLATFMVFVRTLMGNYKRTGNILDTNVVKLLWRDITKIAFTDFVYFLLTFESVFLQRAIANKKFRWNKTGLYIQSVYESVILIGMITWPIYRDYPWIGRVFLTLHSLVLLMKQHSYGFTLGYLDGVRRDLELFESAIVGLREEANKSEKETKEAKDQEELLLDEIQFCETELKSTISGKIKYPENVTLANFFDFMMLPTIVYDLEYPRTKRIRWGYFFEKVAAIFGVFFLMITLAEQHFYPMVMHALSLRSLPFTTKLMEYPFLLIDMVAPFIMMYLLTWYLIWDAILNALAELTRFADRSFYGPWWNSVRWDNFARDWNIPVHHFLLRHVYHSSISAFQVSKGSATIITFLLSSVIHELVMFVIFKKLRGYLLCLQMFQLPLVALSKTKFLANRPTLGNVIFWFGICAGPSMMCTLYLTF